MKQWISTCVALAVLAPTGSDANESEAPAAQTVSDAAAGERARPRAHTVTRETISLEVDLQGVIEAENMTPVSVETEAWTKLKVVEAVEHGAQVRRGEALITLENDELDDAIDELERTKRLSEIVLEQKRVDLRHLTKILPLDVRASELSRKQAREDLDHFLRVARPEAEKGLEFLVKRTRNQLEYQKEELRQLEKMYEADDLTEETEEIILKRQRDTVESAMFALERARMSREQWMELTLPRREEATRNRAERQDITWDKAKLTLPMLVEKKRLEVRGFEHQLETTVKRLEELRRDRDLLSVVAPADGYVYYGQFVRGAWSGSSLMAKRLVKGGIIPPREVILTIVLPRPFVVRAAVPEKELGHLSEGASGTAKPTAYSELEFPARIQWISPVPTGPGSFEALVELDGVEASTRLLPGMTCTVRFTPYRVLDALTVPEQCVFAEDTEEGRFYVVVATEAGGYEKRIVTTGRTVQGKTVILEGLTEGLQVLLEEPRGE